MPRKQSQKLKSDDEESSESSGEEYGPKKEMSSGERSIMGGVIAHYLLCAEIKKIPVKRPELVKLLSKEQQKHINAVIKEAKNILKNVYGYELVELDKKAYILYNKLLKDNDDFLNNTLLGISGDNSLLTVILTLIFMNGGTIQEATLTNFLSRLGIDKEAKNDPVFNSISKQLSEYSRQQYLSINTIKSVDHITKEYKWGDRANYEYSKSNILEKVCKIYGGNITPNMWNEQWKEAQKQH